MAALAFCCDLYSVTAFGAAPVPEVTGPLRVVADAYPFNAASTTAVPQDLSKYGYVEEEYLVSGKANVNDFDLAGRVIIKAPDAPYTRIQRTSFLSANKIRHIPDDAVIPDLALASVG